MAEGLNVVLAEYAAINADGTYTVIRGGLTFVDCERMPAQAGQTDSIPGGIVPLSILIEILPGALPNGAHDVGGSLVPARFAATTEVFAGRIEIADTTKSTRFVVSVGAFTPESGAHFVHVRVGTLFKKVPLDVRAASPKVMK